jgi:hypothetical protein
MATVPRLEDLIKTPADLASFRDFAVQSFCDELLDFWLDSVAVEELGEEGKVQEINTLVRCLYDKYIGEDAPRQVNLASGTRIRIQTNLDNPSPEIFHQARLEVYVLLKTNLVHRFYRTIYKRRRESEPPLLEHRASSPHFEHEGRARATTSVQLRRCVSDTGGDEGDYLGKINPDRAQHAQVLVAAKAAASVAAIAGAVAARSNEIAIRGADMAQQYGRLAAVYASHNQAKEGGKESGKEGAKPKLVRRASFVKCKEQRRPSVEERNFIVEGWLKKRPKGSIGSIRGHIKGWNKRYFAIVGHYLNYYDGEAKEELNGFIDLNALVSE